MSFSNVYLDVCIWCIEFFLHFQMHKLVCNDKNIRYICNKTANFINQQVKLYIVVPYRTDGLTGLAGGLRSPRYVLVTTDFTKISATSYVHVILHYYKKIT